MTSARATSRIESICEDTEYLLFIKTPESRFDKVSDAIREFHSYELPEILALPVTAAETNFHEWVLRMVAPTGGEDDSANLGD